ncbi:MAG: universal stress protein [Thermoplasmatota archaeon]
MFRKVLVTVPMEHFPEKALKTAGELSRRTDAKVYLSYIIEDNVFNEVSEQADHVLSDREMERFHERMVHQHRKMARKVLLPEAERVMEVKARGLSVLTGLFSDAVQKEVTDRKMDLIIMEYDTYNLLNYRIMDRSPVPVWIARGGGRIGKIGLFCSNLAPNERSPEVALNLRKVFKARLKTYYINDPKGKMDEKEPRELARSHRFKWTETAEDKVDSFIYSKARSEDFDLIVIGRISKRGYFHLRSRFAKRTDCSVLMIH